MVSPNDEISDDQAAMDADQGQQPGQDVVSREDYLSLLSRVTSQQNALDDLVRENRGLASKLDRGLNAIRRDTESSARKQQVQAIVDQAPEDMRPAMEQMANLLVSQNGTTELPADPAPPVDNQPAYREGIDSFILQAGMRPEQIPQSLRAELDNPSRSVEQNEMAFINGLYALKHAMQAQTPAASLRQTPPRTEQPLNSPPPVDRPSGGGQNIATETDLYEAVVGGLVPPEQARQIRHERGWA